MVSVLMGLDGAIEEFLMASVTPPSQEEWADLVRLKTEIRMRTNFLSSLTAVQFDGMIRLQEDLQVIRDVQHSNDILRASLMARRRSASTNSASSRDGGTRSLTMAGWPCHDGPTLDVPLPCASLIPGWEHDNIDLQTEMLPPGTHTLLVRNIPTRFTQDDLMAVWPADGTFDLLYMPWSSKQRRFSGCAYMNFATEEDASSFYLQWRGHTLESHGRVKELNIVPSHRQGLADCLLSSNREFPECVTPNHLPAVFELGTGRRLDFRWKLKQLQARDIAK